MPDMPRDQYARKPLSMEQRLIRRTFSAILVSLGVHAALVLCLCFSHPYRRDAGMAPVGEVPITIEVGRPETPPPTGGSVPLAEATPPHLPDARRSRRLHLYPLPPRPSLPLQSPTGKMTPRPADVKSAPLRRWTLPPSPHDRTHPLTCSGDGPWFDPRVVCGDDLRRGERTLAVASRVAGCGSSPSFHAEPRAT